MAHRRQLAAEVKHLKVAHGRSPRGLPSHEPKVRAYNLKSFDPKTVNAKTQAEYRRRYGSLG